MSTFNDYPFSRFKELQSEIKTDLGKCASMQEAAQHAISIIYEEFQDSTVLARLYLTQPFTRLLASDKTFVNKLATSLGISSKIQEQTIILSLLGTRGINQTWNDRRKSQGHLGIPLVSSDFVSTIPMVSSLMTDMGIGLDWLDHYDTNIVVKNMGRLAKVFYIPDARTTVDQQHRKIVPAQDFVSSNNIKTVFGLGGGYVNGSVIAIIIFTQETIPKSKVEMFLPLVNTVKTVTMSLVMKDKIFV